jgi:hypothetical protein
MAITTGKEHIDFFLNDIEKMEVQKFADNQTMMNAVRKIFLKGVYFEGILKAGENPLSDRNFLLAIANDADGNSDEAIGRKLRVSAEAIGLIELGFNYAGLYKSQDKKTVDKSNPAV